MPFLWAIAQEDRARRSFSRTHSNLCSPVPPTSSSHQWHPFQIQNLCKSVKSGLPWRQKSIQCIYCGSLQLFIISCPIWQKEKGPSVDPGRTNQLNHVIVSVCLCLIVRLGLQLLPAPSQAPHQVRAFFPSVTPCR